jgi:hypothetical protein
MFPVAGRPLSKPTTSGTGGIAPVLTSCALAPICQLAVTGRVTPTWACVT